MLGLHTSLGIAKKALPGTSSKIFDFTAGSLPNDLTFARASTGTYINSSGLIATASTDTPRFTYSPVTLAAQGLLIEESRTNFLTRSEEVDNGSWFKSNLLTTANSTMSPSGAMTADKIYENSGAGIHEFIRASGDVSVVSGNTYTVSVYAKAAERNRIRLCIYPVGFAGGQIIVDLTNGTLVTGTGVYTAYTISPAGNGWYRISLSATATSTTTSSVIDVQMIQSGTTNSYTGDGASGVYIWGMQVELGAFPTSYIPTTSAAVTRAADTCSGALGAWWNNSEGCIYAEACLPSLGGSTQRYLACAASDASNLIGLFVDDSASDIKTAALLTSAAAQISGNVGTYIAGALTKGTIAYKTNDSGFAFDGTAITRDTSCSVPACTTLHIGNHPTGSTKTLNGPVRYVRIYNSSKSNTELQSLTA